MQKTLLTLAAACLTIQASAQSIVTFETLSLPKADTFYLNYDHPKEDVGFTVQNIHFQCVYDTAYGGSWSGGFAYSNMTDSVTSGYTNEYSAKTAEGWNNSAQYAVYFDGYSFKPKVVLNGGSGSSKKAVGFYVTNSTYAYNSMRDGDFVGKKFGGVTGTDPDWFKLTIFGYWQGQLKSDSVTFYLADFRSNDPAQDYIVRTWEWVDLLPMGDVDSLEFHLSSSDVGQWGMNTPAYFCMDNFSAHIITDVQEEMFSFDIKVYPNPVQSTLYIETQRPAQSVRVMDLNGRLLQQTQVQGAKTAVPVEHLAAGTYLLLIDNGEKTATARFVKH